ncbi:hypothetical protein HQ29_02425 [Porphyromonas canoris]|nr:hypothetical protein HQ29_02425 [Porphyromonas canoris]
MRTDAVSNNNKRHKQQEEKPTETGRKTATPLKTDSSDEQSLHQNSVKVLRSPFFSFILQVRTISLFIIKR